MLDFTDNRAHRVAGMLVTNSTYATLAMEQGDEFSKKFGGGTGSDPDYLKLHIWGYTQGFPTDIIEYYLADYRFENDSLDYLVKTWQWVDLSSLGEVDSLLFGLESSDMGDWGMNTPGFFCIDNVHIEPGENLAGTGYTTDHPKFDPRVYPNPNRGRFMISTKSNDAMGVQVYNMTGSALYENPNHSPGEMIDICSHPAGSYLIRVTNKQGAFIKIIQKQ